MKFALLFALVAAALTAQDDAAAHYRKGKDAAGRQQWQQAVDEYREALRLQPGYQPARLELARLQVASRQFDTALASINQVLQAEPDNQDAEIVRAAALIGLNKPGVARLFLQDALKKHPDAADLLFELAVACLADRRFDEAERTFLQVAKAEPAAIRGLSGVIETHFLQKDNAGALEVAQREAAKAPERRDLAVLLGNTASRADKLPIAVEAYRKALAQAGPGADAKELADLNLRLGEALARGGDTSGAVTALEKARDLAPGDVRVLTSLALTLDTGGRKKEAGPVYAEALAIEPKSGVLLNNYAYLLAETGGDLKLALEYAQRAREVMPNSTEITDTVGWIYLKANMTDAALDLFRTLVVKRPTTAAYRYHFAMALEQSGDRAGALRELRDAVKYDPTPSDLPKIREMIERLSSQPLVVKP